MRNYGLRKEDFRLVRKTKRLIFTHKMYLCEEYYNLFRLLFKM